MASEAKCKECWFAFKVERRHKIGESCPALAAGYHGDEVAVGLGVVQRRASKNAGLETQKAAGTSGASPPGASTSKHIPSLAQVQAQKEATYTALVVPPVESVTKVKMGRPKRYESDAERQKAYRARKRGLKPA